MSSGSLNFILNNEQQNVQPNLSDSAIAPVQQPSVRQNINTSETDNIENKVASAESEDKSNTSSIESNTASSVASNANNEANGFQGISNNDLLLMYQEINNENERNMILNEMRKRNLSAPNVSSNTTDAVSVEEKPNVEEETSINNTSNGFQGISNNDLLLMYQETNNQNERDMILNEMQKRNISIPSVSQNQALTINVESSTKFEGTTDPELIELWDTTVDFAERDIILAELQKRKLFPSAALSTWEYETGAYPDNRDPEFLQKLLAKREFADSLQTTWKPRVDPCEDNSSFEVTPVQRFVSNFMSPKTPYMSALLFHGVGVG
jgi:hypothetical protein